MDGNDAYLVKGSLEYLDKHPVWNPDGSKIVFSNFGNIFTMDHDGQNVRQLTHHPKGASGPTWSPDGMYILYGLEDLNGLSIFVIDNNGKFIDKLPQSNKEFSGWTDLNWKY